MTDKVAQALTATRLGHPEYRLRIIEGSNAVLHDQVRAGELNLAIVGAVQTQMTRIHLGPSERLSVVANPALDLAGRTEIPLAEVCGFPLVLGIKHLSIHQAFMPKILGVECLLAARAIFLTEEALDGYKLGAGSQALYDALRDAIPFQQEDSYMASPPIPPRPSVSILRPYRGGDAQ